MIFPCSWCLWGANVSRETKHNIMLSRKSHTTSVPPETRDYMVSGERFKLEWQPKHKAYKTQPKPVNLSDYYNHPDYISHNNEASGFRARVYRRVRNFNIRLKLNWVKSANPPGKKLLDYGSGTGDFLFAANKNSWNVVGLEVNDGARSLAQKKGLMVHSAQSEINHGNFDVITLWHVLEHLEDPKAMQQWFCDQLTERGILVIAVPNFHSWDAKYYKEFWAAYDVPRHLWHFSKESIQTIFGDNFEIVQTRPMWFDSVYVSLLSEQYKKNNGSSLRGILVGLWSNLSAILTKEPSSVAYVLRKHN